MVSQESPKDKILFIVSKHLQCGKSSTPRIAEENSASGRKQGSALSSLQSAPPSNKRKSSNRERQYPLERDTITKSNEKTRGTLVKRKGRNTLLTTDTLRETREIPYSGKIFQLPKTRSLASVPPLSVNRVRPPRPSPQSIGSISLSCQSTLQNFRNKGAAWPKMTFSSLKKFERCIAQEQRK